MKLANASEPALESRYYGAKTLVFSKREGYLPAHFASDIWDAGSVARRPNQYSYQTKISFESLASQYNRLTAKELAIQRLSDGDWALRDDLAVRTVRSDIRDLRMLFDFFAIEDGSLSNLTQADLDRYIAVLASTRAPRALVNTVSSVISLWRCSPKFTLGGLSFEPWRGLSSHQVAGYVASGLNSTRRIPENVLTPYLRAAIFYIEVAGVDIIAATKERKLIESGQYATPKCGTEKQRLIDWIDKRRYEGRGIPSLGAHDAALKKFTDKRANFHLISQMACISSSHLSSRYKHLVEDAVEELGFEEGGFDTEISINPATQKPWRDRFSPRSLNFEIIRLYVACYIIIAFLSGMRDSEVQGVKRGCIRRDRSSDGLVIRYKLTARVWKNEADTGTSAEWVVHELVAKAIETLEALGKYDDLFLRDFARKNGPTSFCEAIHPWLNLFSTHASTLGFDIPRIGGENWVFNAMQFRRTLASYIARQPFGVVAGMIQYKHLSVAIFEGYAGTSESGFRGEVEEEEALMKLEDVLSCYESHKKGEVFGGPGGSHLHSDLQKIQNQAEDFPGMIVDQKRLRAMLKNLAERLHVSALNDCYFNEATAVCLQKGKAKGTTPKINMCEPSRCSNSVIRIDHLPAWKLQEQEALKFRKLPISSLQKELIDSRLQEIKGAVETARR